MPAPRKPLASGSAAAARGPELLTAAAIGLVTFLAYLPALRAGFIWDDDFYLTGNRVVQQPGGLVQTWTSLTANPQYYPLVFTTFIIEYRLWKLNPAGYHAVNVALHAAASLMLWRVLRRLALPGAALAALLFAVHPVHVESVAWITERKNVLSGLFYFMALASYLKADPLDTDSPPRLDRRFYVLALFAFLAALLSKTVTCSLPAAILLLIWWRRGRCTATDLRRLLPFFAIGLVFAALTAWVERHHVGARRLVLDLDPLDRVLIAGRAVWFYLFKLAWPSELTFIYPRWQPNSLDVRQWCFPMGVLLGLAALFVLRARIGRGAVVAALLFVGTLAPALGFIDFYPMRYSFVADHFQYLASVPILAAAAALWSRRQALRASPARYVPLMLVGLLAGLTWRQCGIYRDARTLWRDTITKNPAAWMAHNNLGAILVRDGDLDAAQRCFETAWALQPRFGRAASNLAYIQILRGNPEAAIELCQQALAIPEAEHVEAWHNLGQAQLQLRRPLEAIASFAKAIEVDPQFAMARLSLAETLMAQHRGDEAEEHLWALHRLEPDEPDGCLLLAERLAQRGRIDDAIALCGRTIAARPHDPRAQYRLAQLYLAQGRPDRAAEHAGRAVEADPGFAEARVLLGTLRAQQGRLPEAIAQLEQAARLQPRSANAHYNLGNALLSAGRLDDAIRSYEAALALDPEDRDARAALESALRRRAAGR